MPTPQKPEKRSTTQADIDAALQEWNGDLESKRAVAEYMQKHARDKDTAAFLRTEYGDDLPAFPITVGSTSTDLPWPKVQRRIAQLIQGDRFYTQEEQTAPDLSGQPITRTGDTITVGNGDVSHEVDVTLTDEQWAFVQQAIPDSAATSLPYKVDDTVYLENGIRQDEHNASLFTPERPTAENFRITDDHLGEGGVKIKYGFNIAAIRTLKQIEAEGRAATPEEQETLSRYVGWGGIPQTFDPNNASWAKEYAELVGALTAEEYEMARASTLNAHYTSPTVIRAIYEAVGNMGFQTGNILEPACGIGNLFGLLPESMAASRLYGVELDSITGRIAKQLYPNANITVAGFETTDRKDFFDLAVGNVPFGNYKVADRAYDKLGFPIHDYFFAKTLDQVRPGGVIAFVTSRYTMDKQSPEVRRYNCTARGATWGCPASQQRFQGQRRDGSHHRHPLSPKARPAYRHRAGLGASRPDRRRHPR